MSRLALLESRLDRAVEEIIEMRALNARLRDHVKILELQCDAAAPAVDALEKMHDELGEKYRDSETERLFWRSAAERALRLWEQEARAKDKLLDAVEFALSSSSTTLSYENWTRLETLLDE